MGDIICQWRLVIKYYLIHHKHYLSGAFDTGSSGPRG
jgi:hypothetical protein